MINSVLTLHVLKHLSDLHEQFFLNITFHNLLVFMKNMQMALLSLSVLYKNCYSHTVLNKSYRLIYRNCKYVRIRHRKKYKGFSYRIFKETTIKKKYLNSILGTIKQI